MKNGLSAYLDRVRAGESIVVTDRGVPVARLDPIAASADPAGRVERLVRAGLMERASVSPPFDVLETAAPRPNGDGSALRALLDEREASR